MAVWLKTNMKYIYRLLLIILWAILYQYNYITIYKLIIFFLLIFVIFLYKLFLDNKKYVYLNKLNILIILFFDILKLIYIYIIIYLYVLIYYLSKFNFKFFNYIIWIINHIIINPVLALISRIYCILEIWKIQSLIDIFFNRIYGWLFSLLVFTPILTNLFNNDYIYIYIYLYIIWIIINIIHDYIELILKNFKYGWIFLFVNYMKLYKDINFLLMIRTNLSIFSYWVLNNINQLPIYLIPKSAFYFNFIQCIEIRLNKCMIIDYNYFILHNKIIIMKNCILKNNERYGFFDNYYILIYNELWEIFKRWSEIEFLRLQMTKVDYIVLTEMQLNKISQLKIFIVYLLKLILFFFFNIFKLIGITNIEILNLLENKTGYFLEFNQGIILNDIFLSKISLLILDKYFLEHRKLFESIYLYINIWEYCKEINEIIYINTNNHILIKQYIEIFKKDAKEIFQHSEIRYRYGSSRVENLIEVEIENLKINLLNEWVKESEDLTELNLYEKSYKRLDELNLFVEKMINKGEK